KVMSWPHRCTVTGGLRVALARWGLLNSRVSIERTVTAGAHAAAPRPTRRAAVLRSPTGRAGKPYQQTTYTWAFGRVGGCSHLHTVCTRGPALPPRSTCCGWAPGAP